METDFNFCLYDQANGVVLAQTRNRWAAERAQWFCSGLGQCIRDSRLLAGLKWPQVLAGQEPAEAKENLITPELEARAELLAMRVAALDWVSRSMVAYSSRKTPAYALPGVADALEDASEAEIERIATAMEQKPATVRMWRNVADAQARAVVVRLHELAEGAAVAIFKADNPVQIERLKTDLAATLGAGMVVKAKQAKADREKDRVRGLREAKRAEAAKASVAPAPEKQGQPAVPAADVANAATSTPKATKAPKT